MALPPSYGGGGASNIQLTSGGFVLSMESSCTVHGNGNRLPEEMPMTYALLFELNSIQPFIFSSGRLRDVAGASELLDRLTSKGGLLDAVCQELDPDQKKLRFSRRAGGVFYAFSDDRQILSDLRDLWTLSVQQWAPGLDFSVGQGEGDSAAAAFTAARRAMSSDASRLRPRLPVAAPVTERSPRTGLAAETTDEKSGPADAAVRRFREFADLAKAGFLERYSPPDKNLGWRDWPRNLESDGKDGNFPFLGENRTVALIKADGNGLGQVLRRINEVAKGESEKFIELYRNFSDVISQTTQQAARAATEHVLLPARKEGECLPARPILLGGDDIVILVRGDLALGYCKVFAREFEKESKEKLKGMQIKGLPGRLTLGFGVVYLRASQPFYLAERLAEELMVSAKKDAKEINHTDPPSSLVLYRITSSLVDDYDRLIQQVMTHRHRKETYVDTLTTYYLDDNRPALSDLEELTRLLGSEEMARGPTRQLMALIGHSFDGACSRYRRWRQLMQDERCGRSGEFGRFEGLLRRIGADRSGACS